MFKDKKKGISPVVASVMLVSLVLVLVVIVFTWSRGLIAEQIEKGGKPIESVCDDVAFEAEYFLNSGGIDVQIVNRGNVPIYNFDIKYIGGDGDTEVRKFDFSVDVGGSSAQNIIPVDSSIDKVVMYPMVLGSVRGKKINKPVTCLERGKVIDV